LESNPVFEEIGTSSSSDLAIHRGLPQAIRTNNGKEFCGRAMLGWTHEQGMKLHVQTEMSLHVLAYNLKWVIKIVGMGL